MLQLQIWQQVFRMALMIFMRLLSPAHTVWKEFTRIVWRLPQTMVSAGVAVCCLGCTIETTKGLKRCCKDGSVFDAGEVIFDSPTPRHQPLAANEEPDLSVEIAAFTLKILQSQAEETIALVGPTGAGGNMNSIGLQNPDIPYYIENLLPSMIGLGPIVITNLAGSDIESYVEGTKLLDKTDCDMIELNISCPNIKAAGLAWGMSADTAFYCVSAVRAVTKKPLMVKFSPNAADNRPIAIACIKAGADAISLINTIHGVAIDIDKGKPLALRIVYDVVQEINKLPAEERVPVVSIGRICTWQDAVEFIMAGASAVEIVQAKFTKPNVAIDIQNGLRAFMKSHGYHNLSEMRGIAQVARHNKAHTDEKGRFADLHAMMK